MKGLFKVENKFRDGGAVELRKHFYTISSSSNRVMLSLYFFFKLQPRYTKIYICKMNLNLISNLLFIVTATIYDDAL